MKYPCDRLPCESWQATRNPAMTDEQFQKSVKDRTAVLKSRVMQRDDEPGNPINDYESMVSS